MWGIGKTEATKVDELAIKKLHDDAKVPFYAHATDAGLDLCYFNEAGSGAIIESGARGFFTTGLSFAIPEGYVGLIWDKSGLAAKSGLQVLGGVIDAGYRGEVNVMLLNTGQERVSIAAGQKIAQILIQKVENPMISVVEELPEAGDERGEGGFGSTGL